MLTILDTVEWHGLKLILLAIHAAKLRGRVEGRRRLLLGHKRVARAEGCWLLLRRLKSVSLLTWPLDTLVGRLKLGIETIVWRPKFKLHWLLVGFILLIE